MNDLKDRYKVLSVPNTPTQEESNKAVRDAMLARRLELRQAVMRLAGSRNRSFPRVFLSGGTRDHSIPSIL